MRSVLKRKFLNEDNLSGIIYKYYIGPIGS